MQRSSLMLRAIVLASSALLAVGYLSYRAGAFAWMRGEVAGEVRGDDPSMTIIRGSKPASMPPPDAQPQGEKTIIYSTKFAPIGPNSNMPTPPPPPQEETGKLMIMSGTKSDAGLSP